MIIWMSKWNELLTNRKITYNFIHINKTYLTYRDANNKIVTVSLYDLKLDGLVWRGKQKIRGVLVNRSFHNNEIISTGTIKPK